MKKLSHVIKPYETIVLALALLLLTQAVANAAATTLFDRTNLVAWCIVPFDAKKRGPVERAAMMQKLGLKHFAYDYRAEHIPTFDKEIEACKRHGVSLDAWWFPGALNDEAKLILSTLKRHDVKAQLWVTGGGGPTKTPEEQQARIEAEAARIRPIAEEAAKIGCSVALYNHGAWFGNPDNQIAIIKHLKLSNVGIVYNQHHGHDDLDHFPELLARMKPHLLALNLNGMTRNGDKIGKKILPIGQGDLDVTLLRIIRDSGWQGPIGILNHTDEDAEARLLDNIEGLEWVVAQLDGKPAGEKPKPRSWKEPARASVIRESGLGAPSLSDAFGKSLSGGMVDDGKPEYRRLPITVECRARLQSRQGFNILVASDEKSSAEHWELYSYAGSGVLSVFLPGRGGEVRTDVNICDDKWHYLAAVLEPERARLYVDGKMVADKPLKPITGSALPGKIAFGRLVEGAIGCDGFVDDVRISKGVRPISETPKAPAKQDEQTVGLWNFDDARPRSSNIPMRDPWALEDEAARAALPEFKTIPAATLSELTPASGYPRPPAMTNWHRSHGDSGSSRYSALAQINRGNVRQLQPAWTYHSKDGSGNIQANPIIVDGVMYAPTVGHNIAAVNAETGIELWRFKPEMPTRGLRLEDLPARRGLVYWPGNDQAAPRIIFTAGNWIYALNAKTGKLIGDFGKNGRTRISAGGTAAGAIYKNVLIMPGFNRDVFGFDVVSGELLWTFHTIPNPDEFGYETWSHAEDGANCWGGMALDEERGIACISTGSPKPNFVGGGHAGDNLFSNCVIALDALTGKRIWHFQEIRHDIWDLDIPAPPTMVTVTREGRKVHAVAQVTKLGNTLLLDRLTGKPLFPFRLRRAPVSKLAGEWTAAYQPAPELPEPFARQVFSTEDITRRDEDAHEYISKRIASANFGFFQPFDEGKPTVLYGIHGGAEWTGASFDPASGYLYVSANELPWIVTVFRDDEAPPRDAKAGPTLGENLYQQYCATCHGPDRVGVGTAPPLRGLRHRLKDSDVLALLKTGRNLMPAAPPMTQEEEKVLLDFLFLRDRLNAAPTKERPSRPSYTSNGYPKLLDHEGYPGCKPPWGTLNCIDLNTGKLRWKVPLGEYPELTAQGMKKTGTENFGGSITTAGGLVFCAGTRDGKIRAFDSATGAELWEHKLPWGGYAPPATYSVNGRQYIVIAASGGGKLGGPTGDAYVAFALPSGFASPATARSDGSQ